MYEAALAKDMDDRSKASCEARGGSAEYMLGPPYCCGCCGCCGTETGGGANVGTVVKPVVGGGGPKGGADTVGGAKEVGGGVIVGGAVNCEGGGGP